MFCFWMNFCKRGMAWALGSPCSSPRTSARPSCGRRSAPPPSTLAEVRPQRPWTGFGEKCQCPRFREEASHGQGSVESTLVPRFSEEAPRGRGLVKSTRIPPFEGRSTPWTGFGKKHQCPPHFSEEVPHGRGLVKSPHSPLFKGRRISFRYSVSDCSACVSVKVLKIHVAADTNVSLRGRGRVTNTGPAGPASPSSLGAAWPSTARAGQGSLVDTQLLPASARGSLVKEAGMWVLAS